MAMEYFCCYHSYARKLAKLSDQEVGRLFRALLDYSEHGEAPELAGRESVAFDFIADDIDRAKAAYEAKCEQNKINRASTTVNDRQRPSTTVHKNKDKSKEKNKDKGEDYPPVSPLPENHGFGPELEAAFSDWLAYKKERREPYKPTGIKSLVTEVRNNAAIYGEAEVAKLIRSCMASNWKGIIFDRLGKQPQQKGAPSPPGDNTWMKKYIQDRGKDGGG